MNNNYCSNYFSPAAFNVISLDGFSVLTLLTFYPQKRDKHVTCTFMYLNILKSILARTRSVYIFTSIHYSDWIRDKDNALKHNFVNANLDLRHGLRFFNAGEGWLTRYLNLYDNIMNKKNVLYINNIIT